MRSTVKKLLALSLTLALLLALVLSACGSNNPEESGALSDPGASASQGPGAESAEGITINLAVLSGPTGVGAAKLMDDNKNGLTANAYNVKVCTDNNEIVAGLTNEDFDIAAIATNVASNLYNKSNGGIQIAAINTLGVLYILGPADKPLSSLSDLSGKTLYATGQGANPQYVLDYLLTQSGARDVDVVWQTPDEVTATMLQDKGEYCMLPVPAATTLEAKSQGKFASCINLTDVWEQLRNNSELTMGCVVVRTAFAQEHPEAVSLFLEEYQKSLEYMADTANLDAAAALVAEHGIVASPEVAKKAIPQCNLVYLDGSDMRAAIQGYYEVLFDADPTSIGGSIPDDGFYFEPGGAN